MTTGRDEAMRQRVLIIGLDGVTWTVLTPLMQAGKMPRLREIVERGASGILRSTIPPITPAAWTSFLTGKHPGEHGILDFERYDPLTNKLSFNSTRCLDHVRNLWQIFGRQGLRVGSVNVPMTYPPPQVNGFLVSGFETPNAECEFAYPRELRAEILSRWPDPTLRAKWKHTRLFGGRTYVQNLDYISRSFDQGAEMTTWLADRFGWDALMVVFKLTDNLQHKTWKYLDPRWTNRNPTRRMLAEKCFTNADVAVGKLLDYAAKHDAKVMIVSDHGHGSLEGKVQPNLLLERWGYLALRSGGVQQSTRLQYIWDRIRGKKKRFLRKGDIARDLAVDFSGTRACIMHAGMAGFLYLNLLGRQPCGIVEQREYESLRDELRMRFLGPECRVLDPAGTSIALFSAVHKPEELYNVSRKDQPWMPDLILIPHETLAVVRRIKGNKIIQWLPYSRTEGTHRPEGVIAVSGAGIRHVRDLHAHIVDCAPTILAMLGLPIPDDMNGRVLDEIFEQRPQVIMERRGDSRSVAIPGAPQEEIYSERDMQQITERLSNLGYLE
ncbi:MAG: alkaline phosphatase family protein [Planctomycetes bacterium]|nr:alkaline phosphatase family protein [Planctomycetota bacterium]MBI3834060.1 alkaline phosphatase family protein [Planctomycetota bacterium]